MPLQMITRVELAKVLGLSLRTIATLEATKVIAPKIRGKAHRPSLYDLSTTLPKYVEHCGRRRRRTARRAIGAMRRRRSCWSFSSK